MNPNVTTTGSTNQYYVFNHPTGALQPYSETAGPRPTEVEAATTLIQQMSGMGFSHPECKPILMRLISLYNDMAERPEDWLLLAGQDEFSACYPKLNQWINSKLDFLDHDQVFKLAFVSGHFGEYQSAQGSSRSVEETRRGFFRRYFQQEGKENGLKKLDLLNSLGILKASQVSKLMEASFEGHSELEQITATKEPIQFDFAGVFKIVTQASAEWKSLAYRLGEPINHSYVEKLSKDCLGSCQKAMLTMLNDFALHGRAEYELIAPLERMGKNNLAQKLNRYLLSGRS